MPQLSSSNRSQLGYKREGTYPTNFGVPQSGNGALLKMLSETLDYTIKNVSSEAIRSDRQTDDVVQVGASAAGGFAFEMQYREYDPFIEGAMQSTFTAYGTNGVSSALPALTLASGTITAGSATSGADSFATLAPGQWFVVIPPAAATQAVKDYFAGRAFRNSLTVAATTTVITLDAATPINTTIATTAMAAGGKIGSSRMVNASTMDTYTLEVGHADIGVFRQYTGQAVSKMDLKLSVGSIVTGSFEFMGKSMNLLSSTGLGTPADSFTFTPANATRGVFDVFENGAPLSAITYVKSGELSITNSLRAQEAVGVFGNAGVGVGSFKAMGKLELYFASATMYAKFIAGTASSLTLPILDVNGNGYVFHFPRIKYSAAKVAVGGKDQDNMLQMDFEALVDTDSTSPTYNKTVAIYRVGGTSTFTVTLDTRPRFGLGAANAYSASPQALIDSMTPLTGSSNGGAAGTFNLTTTSGNYGWVAILASASGAPGVRFFDGTGYGGWSGAGLVGNNSGASPDPTTSSTLFTDSNGTQWRLFRTDFANSSPSGQAYTLST